jgi:small neutral amino acid transporter SnatA (MarC family)
MIHGYEDLFVGSVAAAIGFFLLTAAARNWPQLYSLRSSRWLESHLTRTKVRILHALLGLALMALGLAIAQGYRWQLWN